MSYKRGFTLIELLVVIAIIGILSSIVLASLNTARQKGRDARRVSDIKQLQLANELYYDTNAQYAVSVAVLATGGFIAVAPKDPQSNLGYAYAGLQGSAANVATCGSYHIGAKLEQTNTTLDDNDADDTTPDTICTGGGWAGNADIAAVTNDFSGADPVFDVKP